MAELTGRKRLTALLALSFFIILLSATGGIMLFDIVRHTETVLVFVTGWMYGAVVLHLAYKLLRLW